MPRHYDEFAWHWSRLSQVHNEGRLVFVLGAGVNVKYRLPSWPSLIRGLLINSGRIPRLRSRNENALHDEKEKQALQAEEEAAIDDVLERLTPDPLLQAALVRAAYPSTEAWIEAIRARLQNAAETPPETDGLPLRLIASMLVSAHIKNPRAHISVLTFNYDTLLEDALRAELQHRLHDANVLQSISDGRTFERTWTSSGIYIYHLHGFLGDIAPNAILDAYSYVPVLQGNHWSWRCMERVLSQNDATALLIGLSLTDPSLRFVLTRWEMWKTPVLGVYLSGPLPIPDASTLANQRDLTFLARAILDLYDSVMDRLQLVSYHLSTWDELEPILQEIGKDPNDRAQS